MFAGHFVYHWMILESTGWVGRQLTPASAPVPPQLSVFLKEEELLFLMDFSIDIGFWRCP
jgi:hypothetical protein